ncbi:hypothetical protein CDD80_447 [Ophiocordyceps camponoti-rufipedis]|uniref:Uncharacterized protein n=1 Tax=Ophiocordyceps camponoti-rufipedis TaxID=2004952 RepID=A0A2C5XPQ2_9HYPO|nr:hypothetical protein CDD80_447 [Ophiocordyceps camponoti-rufipedis]
MTTPTTEAPHPIEPQPSIKEPDAPPSYTSLQMEHRPSQSWTDEPPPQAFRVHADQHEHVHHRYRSGGYPSGGYPYDGYPYDGYPYGGSPSGWPGSEETPAACLALFHFWFGLLFILWGCGLLASNHEKFPSSNPYDILASVIMFIGAAAKASVGRRWVLRPRYGSPHSRESASAEESQFDGGNPGRTGGFRFRDIEQCMSPDSVQLAT